jgi:hypothetical protein
VVRAILTAILVLLLAAGGTLSLQERIQGQRLQLKYGGAHVTRAMRDVIGQGMAIGLLAGFRSVIADFLWIRGHVHWEKKEWLQQYNNMQVVTMLQPQSILFWDSGAWHMAWNIGYAERTDTNNDTIAQGIKRERIWHERARQFLMRGIENIPNRWDLYFKLGWLYDQKFKDPTLAAEQYGLAARFSDAPTYVARMHCRKLAECGKLSESYECWKSIWFQDHGKVPHLWNIVEREIRHLENEMNILDSQRVFPQQPRKPEPPR